MPFTFIFLTSASTLAPMGNVGVDLFFVLSGYLIYGMLLQKERPFAPYLRRRIERIYPTFITVFVLYVVLSFVFPEKSKIPDDAAAATTYIAQNLLLLPGMFDIDPIITVAWSLSYEFFFYLTVPLLIFVLGLRGWSAGSRIAFLFLLAVVILTFPSLVGGHVRLAMFLSGMLVYELARYGRAPLTLDALGLIGLPVGLAVVIAQQAFAFDGQWKFAALSVSFLVLCWACFSVDGYASKIFRWTPMRWLGNISYSYYLIHGLALNAIFLLLPRLIAPSGKDGLLFWLGLPLAFSVTFAVSSVLFIAVEKPLSLANKGRASIPPS